jgi:hypothetical protein
MWTLKNSRKPQNIFGGLFGGGGSGGGNTANNAAPGNPSAGPAIGSSQSAANPQGQSAAGTQAKTTVPDPQEGLNSLAKLWAAPGEAAKTAAEKGTAGSNPYADLSDEVIMKAVSSAKISGIIQPAQMLAAAGGNQEQANALAGILDTVFQSALGLGAKNAIKISQLGLDSGFNNFRQNDLPSFMSEFTAKQGVAEANPMLTNPAYKPIYDAMVSGFQAQFPNATKEEIAAYTQTHLKTFAEGLLSGSKQQKQNAGPGFGTQQRVVKTENFSDFF